MEVRLVVQSLFGCATHDFGSPPPNPSSVNIGAKLAQDKYIVRLFSLSAGLSIHPFPFCQQKRRKDSDWSKQTKYISNLLCPISFLLHWLFYLFPIVFLSVSFATLRSYKNAIPKIPRNGRDEAIIQSIGGLLETAPILTWVRDEMKRKMEDRNSSPRLHFLLLFVLRQPFWTWRFVPIGSNRLPRWFALASSIWRAVTEAQRRAVVNTLCMLSQGASVTVNLDLP